MRAIAAGVTDVGRERDHNEDRFVLLPEFEVFVVADGMGGHQCGEVASRMATSTIATYFREHRAQQSNGPLSDVLHASLVEANHRIHNRANTSQVHRGMGTTVVAGAFNRNEEKFYVAHAGDSRCYRFRDTELAQLTRDHSLVEEALRTRPDISESELAYLPGNVITRALGVEPTVDVDLVVDDVQLGDLFLLCSDGLHGFVTDERIRQIVTGTDVLTNACSELVAAANENGGGDNITAVLVRIERQDEPWAISTSLPSPRQSAPPSDPPQSHPPLSGPISDTDPNHIVKVGDAGAIDPLEDTGERQIPDVDDLIGTDDTRKVETLTAEKASALVGEGKDARAALEAEDTAQLAAITDPDAILAAVEDTEPGDED
jgi:serine/threonine protein phosphatase PrpC